MCNKKESTMEVWRERIAQEKQSLNSQGRIGIAEVNQELIR